jgi:hypothetical protein
MLRGVGIIFSEDISKIKIRRKDPLFPKFSSLIFGRNDKCSLEKQQESWLYRTSVHACWGHFQHLAYSIHAINIY